MIKRSSGPPWRPGAPWPTSTMLEQMGLVRCKHRPCSTYVDPVNVPQRMCADHLYPERAERRKQRLDAGRDS